MAYHSAGSRWGTATLKFYEGRDNLADKDEAEIDWILDSAYENGRCLVDGDRLFYDGRDFWMEPVDWGGVDPYEVDGPVDDLADWTDVLTRSG